MNVLLYLPHLGGLTSSAWTKKKTKRKGKERQHKRRVDSEGKERFLFHDDTATLIVAYKTVLQTLRSQVRIFD